jgi:Sec-independent protein translocase protein TatA
MGEMSPTDWIAIVVVLFGARRLPDAARRIGPHGS